MKRFWLLVFLFCQAYAAVTQVNSMDQVKPLLENADSETLVVFDIDLVLLQPSDPAF